ncbi:MAG: PaaI family thioesterase [Chloroflexota bacterium]
MEPSATTIETACEVSRNQPFGQFLGAELTRFDTVAELQLPLKPDFQQQNGFAHGGVIGHLADNALTFAGGLTLGNRFLMSEYKIHYLRPARGTRLIARAEVVKAGRFQCVCRCDVFSLDEDRENLCATALGTIVSFRT